MSEKYKTYEGGIFFVTLTTVGWVDVFTRRKYAEEIINNLNYCIENKDLQVFSFCLMPSHLHMIASVNVGKLSDLLRDFKSFTSKKIIHMIQNNSKESRKKWMLDIFEQYGRKNKHNQKYQFWQQRNHPIDLLSVKFFEQKINYIHNNPVEAGIVNEPQNYIYSSANPFCEVKLSAV